MEKLDVMAGFDWLEKEEKIGTLEHESLRGSDVFSFEFDKNWLNRHSDIILGRDLQPFTGIQYSPVGNRIFGCFSDALPDRWGRRLIDLRAHRNRRQRAGLHYQTGIILKVWKIPFAWAVSVSRNLPKVSISVPRPTIPFHLSFTSTSCCKPPER